MTSVMTMGVWICCFAGWPDAAAAPAEKPAAVAPKEQTAPPVAAEPPLKLRRKDDRPRPAKRLDEDASEAPITPPRIPPAPDQPAERDGVEALDPFQEEVEEKPISEESSPLVRATERMRAVEARLARADGSTETVEMQTQIIKDLESLLKSRTPPSSSNSNSDKNSKQKPQSQRQPSKDKDPSQPPQNSQAKARAAESQAKDAAQQALRRGQASSSRQRRLAQRRDVWGHLGEFARQQLEQVAKEDFLPKYRELLEQYYSDIAGRADGDGDQP